MARTASCSRPWLEKAAEAFALFSATSGTGNKTINWTVGDLSAYEDVMLVFKNGAGGGGSDLAFYLFDDGITGGTYTSILTNGGLSHLSVFARGQSDDDGSDDDLDGQVPLPASLPLLAAALGGAGFMARRRKS